MGSDRQVPELVDHGLIDRPLERHDQTRQLSHLDPAPVVELAVMAVEPDVAILAQEAHGEPLLALAAIAAAPGPSHDVRRQLVAEPVGMLGQDLRLGGADLLLELAERRLARPLAAVDAALGHLPSAGE